ncbi:MAG: pyruvate kinase [Planctomycetota bacterium]|nr:pyruvate kinase [Planctomycetota bacterium]
MSKKIGKTRFICTIGPKVLDHESLERLHASGMNIARVNGSHGSLDDVRSMIQFLQEHLPDGVEILLDLPGNKIRTDNIAEPIELEDGQDFVLHPDNLTYRALFSRVQPGCRISAADGAIQLEVTEVNGEDIRTRVLIGGLLANRKGINIRGIHDTIPFDFERDISLLNIAIDANIDWVGLSFVRSSEHVRRVKAQLVGTKVGVVAKVETSEAVEKLDRVLRESDIIMIDRGDLEADIGRENVPLVAKQIIHRARELDVPVIVASQFLCSMLEKPLPLMAEVSDITNAVLDGANILMLSEETAVGAYPFDAIATMRDVAWNAETHVAANYEVVILAAGASTGFGSLTSNKHKCMLDVGGTTIIQHQLENLAACGISDDHITVVTGHNHRQIEAYLLGEGFRGRFVYNPWYSSTNMMLSLWLARPQSNLVVLYGDIIFDRAILADILSTKGRAVLAIDQDSELDPEDEKVIVQDDRVVRGSKDLDPADCFGEFIGLARFDAKATRQLIDSIDARVKAGGLMDFITATFEAVTEAGIDLLPCPTQGRPWNDNDCLADLDRSRDIVFGEILAAHKARDEAPTAAS